MDIIRPITITDAILTASNVPGETNVGVSTSSLAIGTGSKTFATQANLPFAANDYLKASSAADAANYMYGKVTSYTGNTLVITVSVVGGTGTLNDWNISYGWDVGATYAAADRVQVASSHKIYESLAGANIGHDPVADLLLATPLYWKEVSATNRWKAFDSKMGDQLSQVSSAVFTLVPGTIIDSAALLNLDAVGINITVTDPTAGEVYNQSVSLVSTTNVIDAYTYCFESIIRKTDLVKTDIPPYLSATVVITITYAGGTVKVGEIIVGPKRSLGMVRYGPSTGIIDYSTKEADDAGNYNIVEGKYSNRLELPLMIPNSIVDEVCRLRALYRATPLVWIGSEDYSCLIIFGYYKDFDIVIPYLAYSECNLQIEGLT